MKAAWYEKNGAAAQVLQLGQQPDPEPAEGEVRIQLVSSGVNPSDVKSRAGSRPVTAGRVIPHSDGAGVIDKVGPGVDTGRIGERVWTWNAQYNRASGTAAEYIALPAEQAVWLPDHVSFQAGACLGIPAMTAFRAVELARIEPGSTVLIIGGASAVGFYAAQMAKSKGAHVMATVGSEEKADVLHAIGIHDTILYKTHPVAKTVMARTGGKGVQAIIDMDFSTSAALVDQGVLAPHGHYVCFGSNTRGTVAINYAVWLPRSLTLSFFLVYELTPAQRRRAIEGLQAMLQLNTLEHMIGAEFDLDNIVAAHEAVERGLIKGNVVINCR